MLLNFMKLKDGLSPEQHGRKIRTLIHGSYRICLTNLSLATVVNTSMVFVMCPGLF